MRIICDIYIICIEIMLLICKRLHSIESNTIFAITDILGLAWSPSDKFLASCSIDNTIIIWNSNKFPGSLTLRLNCSTSIMTPR